MAAGADGLESWTAARPPTCLEVASLGHPESVMGTSTTIHPIAQQTI